MNDIDVQALRRIRCIFQCRCVLVAIFILGCGAADQLRTASGLPHTGCAGEYEATLTTFLSRSGAITSTLPPWDLPEATLEHLYETAKYQLETCWGHSGRYWQFRLPSLSNLLNGAPQTVFGVCSPSVCDHEDVVREVLPRFVISFLAVLNSIDDTLRILPELQKEAEIVELSHWSKLSLDFVIAGLGHCGTSSLHMNLDQHPGITFTSLDEELLPWELHQMSGGVETDTYRVLPHKVDIDTFNDKWGKGSTPRHRALGLCNPNIYKDGRVRRALAHVPNLKIILVTCDPVDRFEKYFFRFHHCQGQKEYEGRNQKEFAEQGCHESIQVALDDNEKLTVASDVIIGNHLQVLGSLFGPRLILFHQDSLADSPKELYSWLAGNLGVSPFPAATNFRHYNSRKGHRTDLCQNETLLEALRGRLEPEYKAIEEALQSTGMTVPVVLSSRRTRCHRADKELVETGPRCWDRECYVK